MGCIERKQRGKESVRRSILDAALNIAVTEGWHSVTIRKIADAIEYAPPIVYEHFENKEDLIKELIISGFRELLRSFVSAKEAESDPRKILMQASLNQWDYAVNNKELYQLMFSLERHLPNEEMRAGFLLIRDLFMQLSDNDEQLAHELMANWMCLQNGTISTFMQMPTPPELSKTSPRELFKSFIERFLNSIS
jgi:AcrR family transcriptional regulator